MSTNIDAVLANARVRHAFRILAASEAQIEADQIRITLVPAPPFGEAARAALFSEELSRLAFHPAPDAIGNVIASYDQPGPNPVVVGAHLDTVFPAETSLALRRKGSTICLPGISDNGSGLAALLWIMRAAREAGLVFLRPLIAVANVGEEGEGDLRGIRHLFKTPPWDNRACDFIAIDGAGLQRITHRALGSRRFRLRMCGPGGHSWSDFGKPNPVHAMARLIHLFSSANTPCPAGSSFNFGVMRGGISVNAIPAEAAAELDLRSVSASRLDEFESTLRRVIAEVMGFSGVDCRIEPMGERPAGQTPAASRLVQTAIDVTSRFHIEPRLDVASTDANIPMSLGIPAISIGAGGASGSVHTPEEWFDPANRTIGLQRLLALVAAMAGLA